MNFSPNISSVDGGVHGREAIVLGSLCITTVDHGAPRKKGLHNAICSVSHDGLVICACAAATARRPCACITRALKRGALSACACACKIYVRKMLGSPGSEEKYTAMKTSARLHAASHSIFAEAFDGLLLATVHVYLPLKSPVTFRV